MTTAINEAIKAYSELSGLTFKEVAAQCLVEGPIKNSVMMLVFSVALK